MSGWRAHRRTRTPGPTSTTSSPKCPVGCRRISQSAAGSWPERCVTWPTPKAKPIPGLDVSRNRCTGSTLLRCGRSSCCIRKIPKPTQCCPPRSGKNGQTSSSACRGMVWSTDFPDALAVTRDALARAPTEFIGTVVALIRSEKALERSPAGHPNSALRFHILRDLEGCWEDEGLKTAIFEEMTVARYDAGRVCGAPGRAAGGRVPTCCRPRFERAVRARQRRSADSQKPSAAHAERAFGRHCGSGSPRTTIWRANFCSTRRVSSISARRFMLVWARRRLPISIC